MKLFGVKILSAGVISISLLFGTLATTVLAAPPPNPRPQFVSSQNGTTFVGLSKVDLAARRATIAAMRAEIQAALPSRAALRQGMPLVSGERVFYPRNYRFVPEKKHMAGDMSDFAFPGLPQQIDGLP